jgi:hypothetical protein
MLATWLSVVDFDTEYAQATSPPETPVFVDVGGGGSQQVSSTEALSHI